MTQSFWEPKTMEEQQPIQEQMPEEIAQTTTVEPETLALSVDEFSALEDRVLRAVNLVKRERMARAEAEERATLVEAQLREQGPQVDRLQTEVKTLRTERDQVKLRVERLLSQLDALEL